MEKVRAPHRTGASSVVGRVVVVVGRVVVQEDMMGDKGEQSDG